MVSYFIDYDFSPYVKRYMEYEKMLDDYDYILFFDKWFRMLI